MDSTRKKTPSSPHPKVINTPSIGGNLPIGLKLGRTEDSEEHIITSNSLYFNKVKRGFVRRTHKNKRMFANSKVTITNESEVWDNKGKDSIIASLSTTSTLNSFLDANTSHI